MTEQIIALTNKNTEKYQLQPYKNPRNFALHHLESYNHFINFELSRIFASEPPFKAITKDAEYLYRFDTNCYVSNPRTPEDDCELYPLEAEQRNLTYASKIHVNIHVEMKENGCGDTKKYTYQNVCVATIPTMVGSIKCNLYAKTKKELIALNEDPNNMFGYFVTNGTRRTIIGQERANFGQLYVIHENVKGKNSYHAEIRSVKDNAIKPQKLVIKTNFMSDMDTENIFITASFGSIMAVDIAVIFVLLRCEWTFEQMFGDIFDKNIIKYLEYTKPKNYVSAMDELLKHQTDTKYTIASHDIIDNEFLPHMDTLLGKLQYLILGIKQLILCITGKRYPDDRDSFSNKRLDVSGVLLRDLFRLSLKKWIQKHINLMSKQSNDKCNFERNTFITDSIMKCVNTGVWGVAKSPHARTGVCQPIATANFIAELSHTRRFTTPIGRESGALKKIRYLHPSQWGVCDPVESPDGPKIGIIKNLARLTRVTIETSVATVLKTLRRVLEHYSFFYVDDVSKPINFFESWCIYVNGKLIGMFTNSGDALSVFKELKMYRRHSILHIETSISYDTYDKTIMIFTDSGRCIRPVFVLEDDGKCILTEHDVLTNDFDSLQRKGFIQWIDVREAEFSVTAPRFEDVINNFGKIKYNYVELHPSVILGVVASIIPFTPFSQSPRNCYASNMLKQAQGGLGPNIDHLFLTTMYSLWYPQKPLLTTQMMRSSGIIENPPTIGAVVMVGCYGFNQEDSLVVKKEFLERGGAVSVVYTIIDVKEKRKGGQKFETIEIPPVHVMMKNKNYNKLDRDGIVPTGVRVDVGDVIVGKTVMNGTTKIDCSYSISVGEEGIIDKVLITTSQGNKLIKIRIRQTRVPISGDKLAALNGQKATIGLIESEVNLPFTRDGITPDIILSPEALPSRMTLNYILEMLIGKSQTFDASDELRDCTTFNMLGDSTKSVLEYVEKLLLKSGYMRYGNEPMTCGMTGRPLAAKMFIGPMGYMRLKHMVSDKIHSRASGKVQMLSMQPTSGRSNDGGLRMGEMETANAICYGNSRFLFERLLEVSDKYVCQVCSDCGLLCYKKCDACESSRVDTTTIPYCAKLLFQELMATGIKVSIKV